MNSKKLHICHKCKTSKHMRLKSFNTLRECELCHEDRPCFEVAVMQKLASQVLPDFLYNKFDVLVVPLSIDNDYDTQHVRKYLKDYADLLPSFRLFPEKERYNRFSQVDVRPILMRGVVQYIAHIYIRRSSNFGINSTAMRNCFGKLENYFQNKTIAFLDLKYKKEEDWVRNRINSTKVELFRTAQIYNYSL